jgi:hypothetical protein
MLSSVQSSLSSNSRPQFHIAFNFSVADECKCSSFRSTAICQMKAFE